VGEGVAELFREAMAGLGSGVAVVTARRPDGHPCGLAATSVSSLSGDPPSVLVSVAHSSRCHTALVEGTHFGVHVLAAGQEPLAHEFAGRGDDKFAGVDWTWDDGVPRIAGALAYLRCARTNAIDVYDHSLLIGDVTGGELTPGEPLFYYQRSMAWRLVPSSEPE
jgi:flavin reductase (DIM6/NTAB) family NADH-FMN oxidoreductase RutF